MSEELLVRHCAPTLAGLKTANAFSCPYESMQALQSRIRAFNVRLRAKGIRIVPLRAADGNALIYVYRPGMLSVDLSNRDAARLLQACGYGSSAPVPRLIRRLREQESFPHEIGLFLGYPPEDVEGFMTHHAKAYKYSGLWKVYGNEEEAKRTFARYKKCTDVYMAHFSRGADVDRLTVSR